MSTLNLKLLKKARKCFLQNGKSQALDFLLAHGIGAETAHGAIQQMAGDKSPNENFLTAYITDQLRSLLPQKKKKAIGALADYYQISEEFAASLVLGILRKQDFSSGEISAVLEKVRPGRKTDSSPVPNGASGLFQVKMLNLIAEGKESLCIDLLVNELKLEAEEAMEYIEDFKSNLTRRD